MFFIGEGCQFFFFVKLSFINYFVSGGCGFEITWMPLMMMMMTIVHVVEFMNVYFDYVDD
jgi:hypothetical protein